MLSKLLYIAGGLFIIAFLAFICFFAYIIYNDGDGGYANTPLEFIEAHHKKWRSWAHLKFNDWKKYYINFGFIGNIKYVFFKYDMKNRRKKEEFNKNSQDNLRYVLEAVQGDIEEIQKKAEAKINKAKEETDKIRESYLNKEIELKSTDKWEN